jgi:addiction module HigA family antidote
MLPNGCQADWPYPVGPQRYQVAGVSVVRPAQSPEIEGCVFVHEVAPYLCSGTFGSPAEGITFNVKRQRVDNRSQNPHNQHCQENFTGENSLHVELTFSEMAKKKNQSRKLPPIHPGEILREDYMTPLGLTMNQLALNLRVPTTRISEIVHERRGITADTAIRLGRYFKTTPRFWLNLQAAYDLEVAEDRILERVLHEVRPLNAPLS